MKCIIAREFYGVFFDIFLEVAKKGNMKIISIRGYLIKNFPIENYEDRFIPNYSMIVFCVEANSPDEAYTSIQEEFMMNLRELYDKMEEQEDE